MLTAPKLDNFIRQYENRNMGDESNRFTKESWETLKEFYKLLDYIKPFGSDNDHILFFKLPRGPIEDFGDYKTYFELGEVTNKEDFVDLWKFYYPDDEKWYKMYTKHFTRKENEFYALAFNYKFVLQNEEIYDSNYADDISDTINELIFIVKENIEMLKKNEYNSYIEKNLDKRLRYGTITRKDYYNLFPDARSSYLEDLKENEIEKFKKNVEWQINLPKNPKYEWKPSIGIGRLMHMTANDFYKFCLLGYNANKYKEHEGLTAKEAYYKYADGRDENLKDIDENSYDDFDNWLNDKEKFGGHPWEVCRGGNSTHISLYVGQDEYGYYLTLDGKSFGRSIETIRFYNALKDNNAPVFLNDAEEILNRILEKDKIGVVPDYAITEYQESRFPSEKIVDFVNLDYEKENEMIKLVKWQEENKVYLK